MLKGRELLAAACSRSFDDVSEHRCHRCGSVLHTEDEGSLVYCWHCGAPQVVLSEDLQEQAAQLERSRAEATPAAAASAATAAGVDWRRAITLAAAVAAVMSCLVVVLPPMALLCWVWAPMTPAIVMTLYSARGRGDRMTTGAGARLGVVCALFIVAGLALVNALELDVVRFALHSAKNFDSNFNGMIAQLHTQAMAQVAGQPAPGLNEMFRLLEIPEFRAGFFLGGFAIMSTVLLTLTAAGGAFSAAVRSKGRTA